MVVYLTQIICVCAHFYCTKLLFDILKFHISMFTKFLLTEKYLWLQTLDSPQLLVQCIVLLAKHATYKYIYTCCFWIWITFMSLAYASLGASIFLLESQFALLSSVCIVMHLSVFFRFCYSHYFVSIWFAFYILFHSLFLNCLWPGARLSVSLLNKWINP